MASMMLQNILFFLALTLLATAAPAQSESDVEKESSADNGLTSPGQDEVAEQQTIAGEEEEEAHEEHEETS